MKYILILRANICIPNEWALPSKSKGNFLLWNFTEKNIFDKPYKVVTKVIIEKSRGGRFLWNRNLDLGWIWTGLATFEAGFFMFSRAKIFLETL